MFVIFILLSTPIWHTCSLCRTSRRQHLPSHCASRTVPPAGCWRAEREPQSPVSSHLRARFISSHCESWWSICREGGDVRRGGGVRRARGPSGFGDVNVIRGQGLESGVHQLPLRVLVVDLCHTGWGLGLGIEGVGLKGLSRFSFHCESWWSTCRWCVWWVRRAFFFFITLESRVE